MTKLDFMTKNYKNLLISTLLLLPFSVLLENFDGLETVNTIQGYLKEWFSGIIVSLVISGIVFGIIYIFNKSSSYVKVLYLTSYSLSLLIFILVLLNYI